MMAAHRAPSLGEGTFMISALIYAIRNTVGALGSLGLAVGVDAFGDAVAALGS